ncbi:MAG: hypothetical protein HDR09_02570 [Lachnospiraceae bacterium]|nr:hypothetical protein [Lachnospiraceae bacterium]
MTEKEAHVEYDLLKGDINRMFVTDDVKELHVEHEYAKKRLEMIYNYHCSRLNNEC